MQEFVLSYGNTFLCSIASPDKEGCSKQELAYLERYATKSREEISDQLRRLLKTQAQSTKLKASDKAWIRQRVGILKQLQLVAETEAGTASEL